MISWLLALAAAVAWVDPDLFEVAGTRYKTFSSATAGGPVSYLVYLPPSYAAEPDRRYPVVYWLHRADGSQRTGAPFVSLVDKATRSGKLKPIIVVLVNGIRRSWYCGAAEQMIVGDLIPHIDAEYRTLARREARAVEGFSMGGFGAAHLGFKYPELFGAVSVISTSMPGADNFGAFPEFDAILGGGADRMKEDCPWELARRNADRIRGRMAIRLVTGAREEGAERLRRFAAHLRGLGLAADYWGVDEGQHILARIYSALGDERTVSSVSTTICRTLAVETIMPNNGDESRDSRRHDLERFTESLARANRELLTAQVLMQDRFERNLSDLIERQKRTDAQIAALAESGKGQEERIDRLVSAIGEFISRLPPPA